MEINTTMGIAAKQLITNLIQNQQEFKLVLFNNDNWDVYLPPEVLKRFPDLIPLDFKEWTLEQSYIDEHGEIILYIVFGETEYSKVLDINEVSAIVINEKPYIITNFTKTENVQLKDLEVQQEKLEIPQPQNKNQLITTLIAEGAPESIRDSVNMFAKYNKERFKILR
jgi:hypothetical protein